MKIRPDLLLLTLDDDVVVFSEEAQCLFGLNASAAYVVRELQHGIASEVIAGRFASEGIANSEDSVRWVGTTIEALRAHGLVLGSTAAPLVTPNSQAEDQRHAALAASMPPYTPVKSPIERWYGLLGTRALIRFALSEQASWVDAAIGHLKASENEKPTVTLDIHAENSTDNEVVSHIYRDGKPTGKATALNRIGPMVKGALWQSAVNAHDFFFNLHAGVVERNGECILLPAAAGSGKSSLTAALVHRGYQYFSDEVALIEPGSFRVCPVPLALCTKSTGWDIIASYYPEVLSLPIHERMDGKLVRYLASPARSSSAHKDGGAVSHIIFPQYKAGVSTQLSAVPRIEAIRRLMEECLALRKRLDETNVRALTSWISQIDCYELTFSSLDDAVTLVQQISGSSRSSKMIKLT
jgi:hypothetical protein